MTEPNDLYKILGFNTLNNLKNMETPKDNELISKILPSGAIVYLIAMPGVGKSLFTLLLMLFGVMQKTLFNTLEVKKKFNVLYFDKENITHKFAERMQMLIKGMNLDIPENNTFLHTTNQDIILGIDMKKEPTSQKDGEYSNGHIHITIENGEKISSVNWVSVIEQLIVENSINVVILDSLIRFLPDGIDENKAQDMKKIFHLLRPLLEKYEVSFWILHHTSKTGISRGSIEVDAGADVVLYLKHYVDAKKKINRDIIILSQDKARYTKHIEDIWFKINEVFENGEVVGLKIETIEEIVEENKKTGKSENKKEQGKYDKRLISQETIKSIQDDIIKWIAENDIKKFKTEDIRNYLESLYEPDILISNFYGAINPLVENGTLRKPKIGHFEAT